MRKQYHFKKVFSDELIWDVDRLILLSEDLPVEEVPLSEIKEFDENYWFQSNNEIPSPKEICNHIKLIHDADLQHPIILNSDGTVMDGMHRVCKAYLSNNKSIKAKKFKSMPQADFINMKPNELEY